MENENANPEVEVEAEIEVKSCDANKHATASFVLGIVSIIGGIAHIGAVWTLILGIIGLCQASKAKNLGDNSGKRIAGFVINLLAVIFSAIAFIPLLLLGGIALNA